MAVIESVQLLFIEASYYFQQNIGIIQLNNKPECAITNDCFYAIVHPLGNQGMNMDILYMFSA